MNTLNHFVLSKVVAIRGAKVESAPWQLQHDRAFGQAEAMDIVDSERSKSSGPIEYAFRAVPDSELHKYLPESRIIQARERAACAACQARRVHTDAEMDAHTFARHGFVHEQGWTHPLLAKEAQ